MDFFEPGLAIRDTLTRQKQQLLSPISSSNRQTIIERELRTIEPPAPRPAEEPVNLRRVSRELKKKIDEERFSNLLDDVFANQRANRVIDERTREFRSASITGTDEQIALAKQLDAKTDIRNARDKRAFDEYAQTQALRVADQLDFTEEFLIQRQLSLSEAERRRLDAAFLDSVPRGTVIDVEA